MTLKLYKHKETGEEVEAQILSPEIHKQENKVIMSVRFYKDGKRTTRFLEQEIFNESYEPIN